jgi:hypothetical protein
MNRLLASVLVSLSALAAAACLGSLPHEPDADRLVDAVAEPMTLPERESLPHWLLRSAPGWQGAHKRSLGGNAQDGAAAVVRVALFSDAAAAHNAFTMLTPPRLYHVFRHRLAAQPTPVPQPTALAGDEVQAFQYAVRGSFREPPPDLPVDMVAVRAGRAVLLVDSIGLPPARLQAAVAAFATGAASQ